jgi:phosphoribosyl-AMP cyclohydrolase
MYKYFLAVMITILLFSCNRQKPLNQSGDYITISLNPKEALKTINMSEIFSDIEYIPLESVDKHLIGAVNQLIVYKNRYYVFDQRHTQSVFCFQQDGKFLFELNRKGPGPGEYVKLINISIDHNNDHLLLYCGRTHQILIYDLDGNYIKSCRNMDIWANEFSYIGDGYAAFYGCYTTNVKYAKNGMTPNLLISNTDDYKVRYTDLFFPSEINSSVVVANANCFSSYQNGIVSLLEEYNDTIYHISKETVDRAYYMDFGDMKKDDNFYSLLRSPTTEFDKIFEYDNTHNICNIRALTETKTDIYFVYSHKLIWHYVFYNKNIKQIVDIYKDSDNQYPLFYNDIDGGPFVYIYSTDGESFYGTIESYEILEMKESIQQSNAANKDKLIKMLDGITEFDNPIIVKMKMKDEK